VHRPGATRRDGLPFYAVVGEDEMLALAPGGGPGALALLAALRVLSDAHGEINGVTARRLAELTGLGRDGIRIAVAALEARGIAERIETERGTAPSFKLARPASEVIGAAPPQAGSRHTPTAKAHHPRRRGTGPQAARPHTPTVETPPRLHYEEYKKYDECASPLARPDGRELASAADEAPATPLGNPTSEFFEAARQNGILRPRRVEPIAGDELEARRALLRAQADEAKAKGVA
jgi:hypothetical protein